MAKVRQVKQFVGVPVYLTPDEAAEVLHVTRRTVYEWLRTGQLQGHRPAGRWLLSTQQIEQFVSRRKPQTGAQARQIVYDRADAVAAAPASNPNRNTGPVTKPVAVAADPLVKSPPKPMSRADRRRQAKGRP